MSYNQDDLFRVSLSQGIHDIPPTSEQDTDWREVQFPKQIGQKEARTLCRYLVVNLKGDCYVSLHTDKHETFGDRLPATKPQTLEDVPLISQTQKLSGSVTRIDNLANIEFFFNVVYYSRMDRNLYDGMHLAQGVYDWNEMDPSGQALATDIRSTVKEYFKSR